MNLFWRYMSKDYSIEVSYNAVGCRGTKDWIAFMYKLANIRVMLSQKWHFMQPTISSATLPVQEQFKDLNTLLLKVMSELSRVDDPTASVAVQDLSHITNFLFWLIQLKRFL